MGYNQDRQVYFPTIVNPTQLRARRGVIHMKRASTLLALLLALCIAITAWAEGGGIALEIPEDAPQPA